ncbi:DNA repair protein RadC [Anaerocolumna jejuensis DSM 15929]|uniref:DNA repair protein RadC n=1 Tax=Anaerocolumna jejuensis DSM 15929 TaxID=1121322 RepID=A0A1M7BKR2_9FIRM|nr:JAB domain-containing protein [Anaerocolumna jejuensis]SHL55551.1 DNA repair protein RadC [Anaerocolumna jejuensis DSM 15929]
MRKAVYQSEDFMLLRRFSDINVPIQVELVKKRIQIVECRLIRKTSLLYERRLINSPEMAAALGQQLFEAYDKEYLYAVYLTAKCEPIAIELISIGTLNATFVCPRDVIKTALLCSAHGFIIFHNHPSGGDIIPSKEDINMTKRLKEASQLIGVELIDHIILSDIGYVSLKERRNL